MMCAIDHAEDHQGPAIGRARQLTYDYQKVRKDPWLIQSMRELAQHGRAITMAIDVRLFKLMGGEVRVTRNARISTQGRIPSQFWHTVFFEDTKTIIYTRGFEMGVPKGVSAQGNVSTELRDTFAKESIRPGVARVKMEPQNQQWRLIPRVKCFLCGRDILEKICWCPHCHRPISPTGEQLYGNLVLTERDKDHFQAILTRLVELNISVRDISARLAIDQVDRRAMVGMFASMNPAEYLYLQMRTGFQVDEYAARRKPTVYKADLADAVAKSATVSQLIITLVTKLYNNTQHPMKNEILRDDALNCLSFYACETIIPITKAAMMFHTHPPGCSTRPIVWLTNQLTYAYMGAITQGLVPRGSQTRAMMKDHLEKRAAMIDDCYKEQLFKPTDVQKIRTNVNMYLCEDTNWRSLVTYQKDREGHKQRWETPGVGAGLFFHLRRKMFGENQPVDPDDVGNQDEQSARRSI